MKKLFEYNNYRAYLKDLFKYKKSVDVQFSQKWIMHELGVRSSGFISNVLAGKKNLNPAQVEKLCLMFKLTKSESKYFTALVGYDQARNANDKQSFYEILENIQLKKIRLLDDGQLDLFSRWYFVAIRELIGFIRFVDDFKSLSQMLRPVITIREAREAIFFLETSGFIARNSKGIYRLIDSLVSSQNEIKSSSVVGFQLSMINLAREALVNAPVGVRDISAISFCATEDLFQMIKRETQQFRKHLLELTEQEMAKADPGLSSKVYQLNMQLFPISEEFKKIKERI